MKQGIHGQTRTQRQGDFKDNSIISLKKRMHLMPTYRHSIPPTQKEQVVRTLASYALLVKFRLKVKLKIKNLKLTCDFGAFQQPKVREKKSKNHQIFIHCVAKNIEGQLKNFTSYCVCSQIWQIFFRMITAFLTSTYA